ncbi:MAG: rod shape-determining protein MreD [Longimicrobiales bacterium]
MAARPVVFIAFVAILVLLHFILHVAFGLGQGAPDLVTVAALIAARRLRGGQAAALGFVLGILDDALAITSFGASALALTVVSYLGARSRDLFEGESLLYFLVYLFLGTWLTDTIVLLVSPETLRRTATSLLVGLPLIALWTALAGVAAVMFFRAATGERP